jgi:hypothetical protein
MPPVLQALPQGTRGLIVERASYSEETVHEVGEHPEVKPQVDAAN